MSVQSGGLQAFQAGEVGHADEPLPEGPLLPFLRALCRIQREHIHSEHYTLANDVQIAKIGFDTCVGDSPVATIRAVPASPGGPSTPNRTRCSLLR
jgi:hypothetical protein